MFFLVCVRMNLELFKCPVVLCRITFYPQTRIGGWGGWGGVPQGHEERLGDGLKAQQWE